ncbi:MAG: BamA/TamA family outer membrane protein [Chitinophagaceae bacterium]|nr:BamA/TamA family outer membrane protein [Chitinophagaceae bacterium]
MLRCFLLIIGFAITSTLAAQDDSIAHRIWLIGDAGKLEKGVNPQIDFVRQLNKLDKKSVVLFLGDNIYPRGLPDSQGLFFDEKKLVLDNQIDLVKNTEATAYFIPGNHDWKEGQLHGMEQLLHQYEYVKSLGLSNVHFVPENACPGPVEVALDSQTVLIVVDTQWWLQKNERPGENSDCDCKNEEEVISRLQEMVYRNRSKLLLFAAHHPFRTNGPHGGYFTWKSHLFPLTDFNEKLYIPFPLIGSLYPILRGNFGHLQDTHHPEYKSMVREIDEVLSQHPYCIRLSGHEHTLQHIAEGNQQYIVSGAASKTSAVRKRKNTLFADEGPGVGLLEISKAGNIRLQFYAAKQTIPLIYDTMLARFQPKQFEIEAFDAQAFPDSITLIAAPGFKAGSFKRMMWGDNYRDEWTTPIRVPVFDIGKEKGGLIAVQRGGRLQSKSLRLEDKSGQQYVLRSIVKYPERILPEEFRETFLKNALIDAISASYPYAAISVPIMATAAGVPHANPKIVYLPNDARLGLYRSDFANALYIFEEREPGGLKKTYSTPKVLEELADDNDNIIDHQAVLQARLLDMFMMDFDRHEDQWRWGRNEREKKKIYYPIPRDRDQPFFINQGIIPRIISRSWIQPRFQGFRRKAKNINTFNFNGRYFDRLFLSNLSSSDWSVATDAFLPMMTDSVIETALKQQPPELHQYSLNKIISTLKQRRQFLKSDVMEYYKFLAREVDIYGSDKNDAFDITRNADGTVSVRVYKITKEGKKAALNFDRLFHPADTKEIRLWGMGGADVFKDTGDAAKTILVRIIGGVGRDSMYIASKGFSANKTRLYDLSTEKNSVSGSGKWLNGFDNDPAINETAVRAFKYDVLMPMITATYNPDDGVFFGLMLKYTKHGFRKQPHKVVHQWKANYAVATGAYSFNYAMDAIDVIGKADIVLNAAVKAPNYTSNFFGLGNETIFDKKNGKKIGFYRTRYNLIEAAGLLRFNPSTHITILAGPAFQSYFIDSSDNQNKIITSGTVPGVAPASVFENKAYLGGRIQVNVDFRNNQTLTSRGFLFQSNFQTAKGLTDYSNSVTQFAGDLSVFTAFSKAANLVLAGRVGGGVNFGKYEFFQAQYLGGNENLRGYRRYRFAGDKMLYANVDARLRLFDFRGYVVPGTFGILAFNDIGRVWVENEASSTWHYGYGGGIWIAPANRYVVTACLSNSKDGLLPFLSLGFQF